MNNNVFNQFGGYNNVMAGFNKQFPGMTPEQAVKQCLNDGRISQSQFETSRILADKIFGSKH